MTRMHFKFIAKVLRESDLTPKARAELIDKFVGGFGVFNEHFDSDTFRKAATPSQ